MEWLLVQFTASAGPSASTNLARNSSAASVGRYKFPYKPKLNDSKTVTMSSKEEESDHPEEVDDEEPEVEEPEPEPPKAKEPEPPKPEPPKPEPKSKSAPEPPPKPTDMSEDVPEVEEGSGDAALPKMTPAKAKDPSFSAGKPSKHPKDKLMAGEGIIPIQSGSNKYATQKGMTGFGVPRDVVDHVKCSNLNEVEEAKVAAAKEVLRLQSGSNKHASQKGQTGFGSPRDVMYKPKGTGGASEVEEEKQRATDGIVILQSGTNKLASQAGMTGIGMPRLVFNKKGHVEQDTVSQGFIHLQMGTNKFASQAGMTGFGQPRLNVTTSKDEGGRPEIPFDEGVTSRQTSGFKEGANQNGMTGFGAFRNTTVSSLRNQERVSQGLVPYQMGINWADSQAGKTGFGMPRQIFTAFQDDSRPDLPEELARDPEVPFWSGMERDFANQAGMTGIGMPRDVKGQYLRRLW